MRRTFMLIAAGAALVAAPAGAQTASPAQPAQNATGEALILVPLTLTKLSDLHFGTMVSSAASGTVVIDATSGARTFTGGVTGIASDAGYHARFAGAGSPNQQVVVTMTTPAQLTSAAGDTVDLVTLTLEGSPLKTIDPVARTFFFGVGGVLNIAADQPEGDYLANFEVTANYL